MSPAKLRCVIVDDDREFLEKMRRWFATNGTDFEVLPFSSGLDATEFLRNRRVDLVLTAYLMPQIDGLQLISIIRSFNTHLPIWMTSSVPVETTALARGADGFLPKAALWAQLGGLLANLRDRASPMAA